MLVGADAPSAFPVSVGDLVGDVEDEELVVVELLGCGLALEQSDRITKMLQAVFSELLGRVVAGRAERRVARRPPLPLSRIARATPSERRCAPSNQLEPISVRRAKALHHFSRLDLHRRLAHTLGRVYCRYTDT